MERIIVNLMVSDSHRISAIGQSWCFSPWKNYFHYPRNRKFLSFHPVHCIFIDDGSMDIYMFSFYIGQVWVFNWLLLFQCRTYKWIRNKKKVIVKVSGKIINLHFSLYIRYVFYFSFVFLFLIFLHHSHSLLVFVTVLHIQTQ